MLFTMNGAKSASASGTNRLARKQAPTIVRVIAINCIIYPVFINAPANAAAAGAILTSGGGRKLKSPFKPVNKRKAPMRTRTTGAMKRVRDLRLEGRETEVLSTVAVEEDIGR